MKKRTIIIEIAIIGIIGGVFLNSATKFMSESDPTPNQQNVDTKKSEYSFAKPISKEDSNSFFQYKTLCLQKGEQVNTDAPRIRITGSFCGYNFQKRKPSNLTNQSKSDNMNFKIYNESTNYNATVFSDIQKKTFSTDFIPLELGTNKISMMFEYENGTKSPVELTVFRKKSKN